MNKVKLFLTLVIVTILLGTGIGIAFTRIISNSNDNFSTAIRNSNGGSWDATYANLQTACNLGGTITLPECNLSIGAVGLLISVDGTQLIGQGKNSQLFLAGGANYRNMINVTADDVLIENIQFDVNNDSQTYSKKVRGIFLDAKCHRVTVHGCIFYNGSYTLIGSADTSLQSNHTIENNHIYGRETQGFAGGITMRSNGNIIRNNRVEDTYAVGIGIEGTELWAGNNVIEGNIVSGYVAVCIYMESDSSDNTTITNNICFDFNSPAYGGTSGTYGILTNGNCTISHNRIYNGPRIGILAGGINARIIITDNEIENIWVEQGISIGSEVLSVTVRGNTVTNTVQYGIQSKARTSIIEGNTINVTGFAGIFVQGTDTIVSGNDINNSASEGIAINIGTRTAIVSDNHINNSAKESIVIDSAVCIAKISTNILYNSGEQGIHIPNTRSDTSIVDNTIIDTTGDGIFVDSASIAHRLQISMNIIDSVGAYGIRLTDAQNSSVSMNIVTDASLASVGIQLKRVYNTTAMGNRVYGFALGMEENTGADWNDLSHNNCLGNTVAFTIIGGNIIKLGNRPDTP